MTRKLTTEEFITKAREIHGDKYDYSKVEYVNARVKVTIICPEHRSFDQIPDSHLRGAGCGKCSIELRLKQTIDKRIKAFKEILKIKSKSKIKLIDKTFLNYHKKETEFVCEKHGLFKDRPTNVINNFHPCNKCSEEIRGRKNYIYKDLPFFKLFVQ